MTFFNVVDVFTGLLTLVVGIGFVILGNWVFTTMGPAMVMGFMIFAVGIIRICWKTGFSRFALVDVIIRLRRRGVIIGR